MLSVLNMYFQNEKYKIYPHSVPQTEDRESLRVLIVGASCKSAESLAHGIIKGSAFGVDQPVIIKLFDFPGPRFKTAVALACQITVSGFKLIKDIIPTDNPHDIFKDIDVAILLNPERTNIPNKEKLNYYFHMYKNLGYQLNQTANGAIKVVIAGEMCSESAMTLAQYASKIPVKNITGLSRHIAARSYNTINSGLKPKFKNVHGIHVWGINRPDIVDATIEEIKDGATPESCYFRKIGDQTIHMYTSVKDFTAEKKHISEGIQNLQWIKHAIVRDTKFHDNDCKDYWIGTAICHHLKDWWNGSEHPVSMMVFSDGSHDIPKGLFTSFPVKIDYNKNWEIIQDLKVDSHTANELKKDIRYLSHIKTQIFMYACKEEIISSLQGKLDNTNYLKKSPKFKAQQK